jgi:hypothetical protein
MPLIASKRKDPQDQRPLFERIQDLIFKLDVGMGVHWFRLGLFCLLTLLVILLYTGAQFYGLRDPMAMDMGQLAHNLAEGRGYVTKAVRPFDVYYLNSIGKPTIEGTRAAIPELWTPPVYPWVLSLMLRVARPDYTVTLSPELSTSGWMMHATPEELEYAYETARAQKLPCDRLLMLTGWLLFLLGLLLTYILARDLFDNRVAVMSAFLYLFCEPLLAYAIEGLPVEFMTVMFLLATYGVFKAEQWRQAGSRSRLWIDGALTVSGLAVALGTLTQYAFVGVLAPLLVYVAVSFSKQWYRKLGLCLAVFALVLAPWMARNEKVSGTMFGLAPYSLWDGTGQGSPTEIKPGQVERTFGAAPYLRLRALTRKALVNLRQLYQVTIKDIGANYLIAFFFVSLLHRFRREEVFRLRRFLLWSLMGCALWLSVAGPPRWNFLTVFAPLVIVYGSAFFYVMFERLQFRTRVMRYGMIGLFAGLNVVPFALAILPPVTTDPYPPYHSGVIGVLGKAFDENEVMVSDIPWAVAWYADRTTIWKPFDTKDYLAINDNVRVISGIYLTQATLEQQDVLEMLSGYQQEWLLMFQRPDPSLPLRVSRPVTRDGEQVLITDRAR